MVDQDDDRRRTSPLMMGSWDLELTGPSGAVSRRSSRRGCWSSTPPIAMGRGAILRREWLYTSHIAQWRKAADAGARAALALVRACPRRAVTPVPPRRTLGAGRLRAG